jgi:hypothetical protein
MFIVGGDGDRQVGEELEFGGTPGRLMHQPNLECIIGAATRRDAVARFSLERMTSNYLVLYQE